MAFFPRHFYNNSNASFTPLFRLLDDFDNYSRKDSRQISHWQPKFDVRETEHAYELHGEFPGVNKDNVHIEFTEPQTLLIRGKTERSYTSGTPPASFVEDTKMNDDTLEGSDTASHQATVEDEYESVESEEFSKEIEHPDPKEVVPEEPVQQKQPVDKAKYWLTERSVGEFSRSFNFPSRVEQDSVIASFNDGILTITVPKAKKHESRRIVVN